MKRLLSVILAISILLMPLSLPVYAAEEESGGFLGAAKGFLGNAISDVTEAGTNAYNTATEKIGGWIDVAGGAFKDAGDWTKAFVNQQGSRISATAGTSYENLQSWLSETGDSSLDVLHIAFNNVAASMGIVGDSATELWNTIQYYAEVNNITPVTMVKLALAIMTMMVINGTIGTDNIVGGAVALPAQEYVEETLELWLKNFDITDQESADKALTEISSSVDTYMDENTWVCASCGTENHGNYCSGCGKERPKTVDTWKCIECGEENHGRFCANCGSPRPVDEESWVCEECGEKNTGNYCMTCGASSPEVEDTWICDECDQECLGQFCSNCGTERPEKN